MPEKLRPRLSLFTFVACCDGSHSKEWPKSFVELKFSSKYLLMPVLYYPFDHGRWLSALCLKVEICTLAKFRADVLFTHSFMVLLQKKRKNSSTYIICKRKLKKEIPKLSCLDFWNLSKVLPDSSKAHFWSENNRRSCVSGISACQFQNCRSLDEPWIVWVWPATFKYGRAV